MIKICDKGIVKPLSIIYKNCTDTGIFPDLWKKSNIVPVHKNHTYVKKVGHTSEFPFGIYWWTLKNLKNQIFEKTKKNCWRYHHFTNVYQKPQSYKVQFLRYGVRQFFCHFGAFFALYLLPNNPENQHFEKMKKASGYVITSNLCNKNHNQMIYAYSDMECNRHNFLSFWLFSHYWPQKSNFQKNVKTTWRYYPFTHVHHKSRSYVWFLWYKDKNAKAKVFCHFRPFFAFWPS